jgi:2-phosphosulfolactate phosphatase
MMRRCFVIDCFPASATRYAHSHAIVAVDVIRATTTMATAVAAGWRCFPAATLDHASALFKQMPDALLAGELGGNTPDGFEITNSPAEIARRNDRHRPLILLSTSGTELMCRAAKSEAVYAACLRNFAATATHVAQQHERVALLGAGSRNEFREEDQICCAWIAERLLDAGFSAEDDRTLEIVDRWRCLPAEACLISRSVDYLRRTGQTDDLDFILSHINDLDDVFTLAGGELVQVSVHDPAAAIKDVTL